VPATESAARSLELATIVRAHGDHSRQARHLVPSQHRVLRAIATCRTAALGGHVASCNRCGAVQITYNSCRNRHCPKCQTLAKERWLQQRTAELLPVQYFHIVFTLPHDLNPLAQGNPRVIYNLLFEAALETLKTFGRDPRHLGGQLGVTAILHTWSQTLAQHLHLHCLVSGGALTPDGSRWIPAKRGFLFPVRALSQVFRGKYLDGLRRAYDRQQLTCAAGVAALADPRAFAVFLTRLRRHRWVVYSKPPCAGPQHVLQYLGRYVYRVAISNDRLVRLQHSIVRFRWRDRTYRNRVRIMDLPADEFLRRFLLHVLPDRFVRIRHAGLLANRSRSANLDRCRHLLGSHPPDTEPAPEPVADLMLRLTGIDIARCPICHHGRLHLTTLLRPRRLSSHRSPAWDTS
jgi:hypothetical protein